MQRGRRRGQLGGVLRGGVGVRGGEGVGVAELALGNVGSVAFGGGNLRRRGGGGSE